MPTIEIRLDAVIFNERGEILLARHEKENSSYWILPGGHLRWGEPLSVAMRRELREEMGFEDVSIRDLIFTDEFITDKRHVVHIGFVVEVVAEQLQNPSVIVDNESIRAVQLFSLAEIVNTTDTIYPSKEFIIQLMENRTAALG